MTQRAIDDVAQTVSRLREFYRQREPQLALVPLDLNRLIQDAAEMTRARWADMSQHRGVAIEMNLVLSPEPASVAGIESEIREALINLIFNAVDALAEGGTITIRTRLIDRNSLGEGGGGKRAVCIEVADTGAGMDEETKRRCLEPFFTTKGDRGTGLGLAMVYGTVQRHNGAIEIESALGQGTTIRLVFPQCAERAAEPFSSANVPGPSPGLRLLIVDDDVELLRSLRQILTDEGHSVTVADGGQAGIDALLAAGREGRRFDAVLTDLGMPQIDGRRVASAVKAASPDTMVCLLTGWGQFIETPADIPLHVDRVLNKPPRLSELREVLAAVGGKTQPQP
jgi:CheY-like chemotaxis protein